MKKVLVVKCGSHVVSANGGVSLEVLRLLARQVAYARSQGYLVAIVSSGAVSCGKKSVAHLNDMVSHQIAAAIGQPILMRYWAEAFAECGETVGQFLETHKAFEKQKVVGLLEAALDGGIVPIINENDAVNTEELRRLEEQSDNDALAGIVAERLDACKLIFLTNVDGLYRPVDGGMELVPVLYEINDEVLQWAGIIPTDRRTGMDSKLVAARQAMASGIGVWIANGHCEVIPAILAGEQVGTHCVARQIVL